MIYYSDGTPQFSFQKTKANGLIIRRYSLSNKKTIEIFSLDSHQIVPFLRFMRALNDSKTSANYGYSLRGTKKLFNCLDYVYANFEITLDTNEHKPQILTIAEEVFDEFFQHFLTVIKQYDV